RGSERASPAAHNRRPLHSLRNKPVVQRARQHIRVVCLRTGARLGGKLPRTSLTQRALTETRIIRHSTGVLTTTRPLKLRHQRGHIFGSLDGFNTSLDPAVIVGNRRKKTLFLLASFGRHLLTRK